MLPDRAGGSTANKHEMRRGGLANLRARATESRRVRTVGMGDGDRGRSLALPMSSKDN
jgi:hypothetical protein